MAGGDDLTGDGGWWYDDWWWRSREIKTGGGYRGWCGLNGDYDC